MKLRLESLLDRCVCRQMLLDRHLVECGKLRLDLLLKGAGAIGGHCDLLGCGLSITVH